MSRLCKIIPGTRVVVMVVFCVLATACAADTDPELFLLPAETTAAPEIAPGETRPPQTTTTTTTTTTTVVSSGRVGNVRRVVTAAGEVRGSTSDNVVTFRAIPYAAPPIFGRRFAAPSPPDPWDEIRESTEIGPACPQIRGNVEAQFFPVGEQSEDCLTVDVFTPRRGDALPVMVWFHGGDFAAGSGGAAAFDGASLARRDVVIVTVNYRLDALGFMVTSDLARPANGQPVANRGIQDQIAALQWVEENIRGFGGDPGNVTIFGSGAGAESVCVHLAAQASAGLFDKAILQSGGGCDSNQTIDDAVNEGALFLAETDCASSPDPISCLSFISTEALLEASEASGASFGVVTDNNLVGRSALSLASTGDLGSVPLIVGSNANEGSLFTLDIDELSEEELRARVVAVLDREQEAELLLSQYPPEATNAQKLAGFITDSQYTCPADRFALVASDDATVYAYQLAHASAGTPGELGATHGSELYFLFGNPANVVGFDDDYDEFDTVVSSFMQQAWTTFARTGSPVTGSGADWPPLFGGAEAHLIIAPQPTLTQVLQDGRCDVLAAALN